MQVGERKLLAPQMHSITITLRVHCWSLISTHRGKQGQRGLGALKRMEVLEREKEGFQENVLRKECIKEIQKKHMQRMVRKGNIDLGVWKQSEF